MANQYRPATNLRQEFPRGEAHTFDPEAFDEAIRGQGVQLVHWRSMGCPQGLTHPDDVTRQDHSGHPSCSNGYLYTRIGTVTAVFTGNSEGPQFQDVGEIDGSTAQLTVQRFYDAEPGCDSERRQAYFVFHDRLYLAEPTILWPHWERVEHNLSGRDRLRFPAVEVEQLVDSRLREYRQGVDFRVEQGQIAWTGDSPGADPELNRGVVYSVRYLYQPYWYVSRVGKAIRVAQVEDEAGARRATRMPFQLTVVRETAFEDRMRGDDSADADPRDQRAPADGSFGPR